MKYKEKQTIEIERNITIKDWLKIKDYPEFEHKDGEIEYVFKKSYNHGSILIYLQEPDKRIELLLQVYTKSGTKEKTPFNLSDDKVIKILELYGFKDEVSNE